MIYACPSCGLDNRIPPSRLNARAHCGSCKAVLLPLDQPYEMPDTATFDEMVRESPLPVVVDFWASWCGPCHAIAPELKKLAAAQAGKAVLVKVNTEQLQDVARRYGIRSIPTLLRFDGSRETKRISGAQSASALADALGLARVA